MERVGIRLIFGAYEHLERTVSKHSRLCLAHLGTLGISVCEHANALSAVRIDRTHSVRGSHVFLWSGDGVKVDVGIGIGD